jgi:hypothetical protein
LDVRSRCSPFGSGLGLGWALACAAQLAGCTAPGAHGGSDVGDDTDVPVAATPVEPVFAAEDIEPAVQGLFDSELYLPLDVYVWFAQLIADLETGTDADCPAPTEVPGVWQYGWDGTCAGTRYAMEGDWQIDAVETRTDQGEFHLDANEVYSIRGDTLPDEGSVYAGGSSNSHWDGSPSGAEFRMDLGGSYFDPSFPALSTGLSAGYRFIGSIHAEGLAAGLDGGIAGDVTSLEFTNLTFVPECPGPTGVLSVRDPSSGWWNIVQADDCSGCGSLEWNGQDYGTTCVGILLQDALKDRLQHFVDDPP